MARFAHQIQLNEDWETKPLENQRPALALSRRLFIASNELLSLKTVYTGFERAPPLSSPSRCFQALMFSQPPTRSSPTSRDTR